HVRTGASQPAAARKCNVQLNFLNQPFFPAGAPVDVEWLHPGMTEPNHALVVKVYDFAATGKYRLCLDLNHAVVPADVRPLVQTQLQEVLTQFLADRSQLVATPTPAAYARWLSFQNQVDNFLPTPTLLELIAEQVTLRGEATALMYEGEELSYQELDERANQVANFLRARGLQTEDMVAVCVDRSFDLVVWLLGILRAGGAYLPLDANYPPDRIAYLLEDSGARFCVANRKYEGLLGQYPKEARLWSDTPELAEQPVTNNQQPVTSDQLIYVYYTSGSTGRPKGVLVEHAGVLNCLSWLQYEYDLQPDRDVFLYKTVLGFDTAVFEIFWPLMTGARLTIAPENRQGDYDYLSKMINRDGVTIFHFVPPMLDQFLDVVDTIPSVRHVFSGGDKLQPRILEKFRRKFPDKSFCNYYGPTEGSIGCSFWPIPTGVTRIDEISIGGPTTNADLYVLGPDDAFCPVGVPGELCIGGIHVVRGYHNRPELTAEKFVELPLGPAGELRRVYRTGDLVRWRADGNLLFLGRIDTQVKIRGVRIEPEEVEKVLLGAPGVTKAIVLVREDRPEQKQLVAYLTVNENYDAAATRQFLGDQ
ncbi:MAG: amino acid adenylation domain-containing protein, partial [Bacteroidota bacterium]